MNYEFPRGQNFESERYRLTRVRGDDVRRAINETGKLLVGSAILIPDTSTFAEAIGVDRKSLYRGCFGGYEGAIRHATGLTVMSHPGIIILEEGASVTPLADIPTE